MSATSSKSAPFRPGEALPNGRTLVAIRLLSYAKPSWAGDMYAVLALNEHNPRDPYAVWTLIDVVDGSRDSFCYSGGYHSDFDAALADWRARKAPA